MSTDAVASDQQDPVDPRLVENARVANVAQALAYLTVLSNLKSDVTVAAGVDRTERMVRAADFIEKLLGIPEKK